MNIVHVRTKIKGKGIVKQMRDIKTFFRYVIPSVLSFALSGIYTIVDGFFVGNSIGDLGLSAVNIAYPIVAVIQALGTGIGMGGAIYYSICKAEKKDAEAKEFTAGALWLLIMFSAVLTVLISLLNGSLLRLLGADGQLLSLGEEYIAVIALGSALQVIGTGLVPFIRNHGGSFYAMVSMINEILGDMASPKGAIPILITEADTVPIFERGMRSVNCFFRSRYASAISIVTPCPIMVAHAAPATP